jgi:hypothetical protein
VLHLCVIILSLRGDVPVEGCVFIGGACSNVYKFMCIYFVSKKSYELKEHPRVEKVLEFNPKKGLGEGNIFRD